MEAPAAVKDLPKLLSPIASGDKRYPRAFVAWLSSMALHRALRKGDVCKQCLGLPGVDRLPEISSDGQCAGNRIEASVDYNRPPQFR